MPEITPRHEFRVFARELDVVNARIRAEGEGGEITETAEVYLVSAAPATWEWNVKVREGTVEIKECVGLCGDLERWKPVVKRDLPVSAEFLWQELAPRLGWSGAVGGGGLDSVEGVVEWASEPERGRLAAWVEKRRLRLRIGECPVELDEVSINGACVVSAAVEGEDAAAVRSVRKRLGMESFENVSYPRAIRRVMGLEPAPGQPWYRAGSSG